MRSYTESGMTKANLPRWLVMGTVSLLTAGLLWLLNPAALAAPAKRVDMSPAPVGSPTPPTVIQTSLEQTPTDELLKDQPLPVSGDQYSENLPDQLPEDEEAPSAPSASQRYSAPPPAPKTATAPRRPEPAPDETGELELDQTPPPTAGADLLAPEVSTEIPVVDETESEEELDSPSTFTSPTQTAEVAEPVEEGPRASAAGTSERRWERGVPRYEQERPNFAFQITSSLQAFGASQPFEDEDGEVVKYDIRNFGLGFDYQPAFLQDVGVLSVGATLNIYPVAPQGGLTEGPLDLWAAGFIAKYQARYIRGQWVVPYVGYETQFLNYKFQDDFVGSGTTTMSGPLFGALLLLNWMEPDAAFHLYSDTGIKRSYLFAEWKNLTAGEGSFTMGEPTLYFGLRLEM